MATADLLSVDEEKSTDYCSPTTQTICDLPFEILENIFQQLSPKDVKSCRLVCKDWNSEIKAHTPQALVVNLVNNSPNTPALPAHIDNNNGNEYWWRSIQEFGRRLLARFNFIIVPVPANQETGNTELIHFVRQINRIKSLHLVEFSQESYACLLKEHQRRQLQQLKISCKLHQNFIKLVLQPCINLKVLKISDIALNSCDVENDWNTTTVDNGNHMFLCPNLQVLQLFIDRTDMKRTRIIDGKQVQLNSKNITLLLRNISSLRLKILRIEVEIWLRRVNSCIGRRAYRYEDMNLQTFICKNGMHLEELDLRIPLSMPKKCDVNNFNSPTLPTSLKSLSLDISTGSPAEGWATLINTELLEHDPSFYDNHLEETNFFWTTLSLAQTQLVKYQIELNYNLTSSLMENIYSVIQNNTNTLEKLSVVVWITDISHHGGIDGAHFEGTKLQSVELWVILGPPAAPMPMPEDVYGFTNFHLLPMTITDLRLLNTKLERHDFVHLLSNLTSLKVFKYWFKFPYIFDLGQIENFRPIVEGLVAQCSCALELGDFGKIADEGLQDLLTSFGSNYIRGKGRTGILIICGSPDDD